MTILLRDRAPITTPIEFDHTKPFGRYGNYILAGIAWQEILKIGERIFLDTPKGAFIRAYPGGDLRLVFRFIRPKREALLAVSLTREESATLFDPAN